MKKLLECHTKILNVLIHFYQQWYTIIQIYKTYSFFHSFMNRTYPGWLLAPQQLVFE